ncbi:MAG: hypothetical protein QM286_11385 [Acidobacteriota bacterium]|nr:hypothetical protein [Acidobacteriota bacterium]NLH70856.1 hypothetical protein [Brooklawnia sp.]
MTARDEASAQLAGLVAQALTGESVELGAVRSVRELGAALQDAGWGSDRLVELRDVRQAAGLAWPFALTTVERGEVGAAQLQSAIQIVLDELGVVPRSRVRDRDAPLSARDRALLADRPPHHGSVG